MNKHDICFNTRVIGLDVGATLENGNFHSVVMKVVLQNRDINIIYFPVEKIRELLCVFQAKLQMLFNENKYSLSASSKETLEEENTFRKNRLSLEKKDLTEVKEGDLIRTIKTTLEESGLTFELKKRNGDDVVFFISDEAVEILSGYTQHVIQAVAGSESLNALLSNIDFMPLYVVDFNKNGEINYDYFDQDRWVYNSFNNYYSILYTIDNNDKKEISCGAIIKTNLDKNSVEFKSLTERVINTFPRLAKFNGKIHSVFVSKLNNPNEEMMPLDLALEVLTRLYTTSSVSGNA